MPQAPNDDDFTPEEIKNFEGVGEDELKSIERFTRWAGQKANRGNPPGSPPPSHNSGEPLTVARIKEMVADPETRSILRHLMDAAETLQPPQKSQQRTGSAPKRGNVLRFGA